MSATAERIDYLPPDVPAALPWLELPLVEATARSLQRAGAAVRSRAMSAHVPARG